MSEGSPLQHYCNTGSSNNSSDNYKGKDRDPDNSSVKECFRESSLICLYLRRQEQISSAGLEEQLPVIREMSYNRETKITTPT